MNTVTRRNFIKLTTAAGLAAASPALVSAAATAPGPFHRTGRPRLQLSLAAYSFREFFPTMRGRPNPRATDGSVPAAKAMDMFKFIDFCRNQGCDGTELTSYFFAEDTDAHMLQLRRHAYLSGIAISGTAIGNNFSHPRGPKRDEEIATTKKWIDRAAALGAPQIRVFAGITKEIPRDEADRLVISALEECCDYAGRRGIFLGLENHDSIGSADTLLPMVKAVKSPWLGVTLDSGNFKTNDPYKDFAACVPYAVNVQFKTHLGPGTPGGSRPADLKRFVKLLRDGGYQGWVALEYEAKEDPWTAVPQVLSELKALCAG